VASAMGVAQIQVDGDLHTVSFSDRPVQGKLGLWRESAAASGLPWARWALAAQLADAALLSYFGVSPCAFAHRLFEPESVSRTRSAEIMSGRSR